MGLIPMSALENLPLLDRKTVKKIAGTAAGDKTGLG